MDDLKDWFFFKMQEYQVDKYNIFFYISYFLKSTYYKHLRYEVVCGSRNFVHWVSNSVVCALDVKRINDGNMLVYFSY